MSVLVVVIVIGHTEPSGVARARGTTTATLTATRSGFDASTVSNARCTLSPTAATVLGEPSAPRSQRASRTPILSLKGNIEHIAEDLAGGRVGVLRDDGELLQAVFDQGRDDLAAKGELRHERGGISALAAVTAIRS